MVQWARPGARSLSHRVEHAAVTGSFRAAARDAQSCPSGHGRAPADADPAAAGRRGSGNPWPMATAASADGRVGGSASSPADGSSLQREPDPRLASVLRPDRGTTATAQSIPDLGVAAEPGVRPRSYARMGLRHLPPPSRLAGARVRTPPAAPARQRETTLPLHHGDAALRPSQGAVVIRLQAAAPLPLPRTPLRLIPSPGSASPHGSELSPAVGAPAPPSDGPPVGPQLAAPACPASGADPSPAAAPAPPAVPGTVLPHRGSSAVTPAGSALPGWPERSAVSPPGTATLVSRAGASAQPAGTAPARTS